MTFRNLSIKRKLMLITMVTSSLALLFASQASSRYDLIAFRVADEPGPDDPGEDYRVQQHGGPGISRRENRWRNPVGAESQG